MKLDFSLDVDGSIDLGSTGTRTGPDELNDAKIPGVTKRIVPAAAKK